MKKFNLTGLLAIIYFVFNYESSIGQPYPFSEEGYNYPVRTNATYPPIKVLVISVQLNGTDAFGRDCDGWITPCFPENGLPVSIDDYFDATIESGGPQGFITKYFYDASFGNFIVLGDYLDVIVNVPYCGASQVPEKVNQILFDTYGLDLPFHHGSALSEFDKYSLDALPVKGYPKVVAPNSRFDHVIYLTRNNPAWGWATGFGCAQTSILANVPGQSIGPMGVDVGCAFGHDGGIISLEFVLSEYFHAIFGHNNWHSGSGASRHTFMTRTQPWGICTQVAGAGMSNVVSGWDRWWLGWNNPPDKLDLISARDNSNTEVNTDLSIPLIPGTNTYVLRDFVSTGDAIRIKIPHFN